MYVVAILRLATTPELEAQALAARLGTHAYDERMKLNAGLPAIVVSTPDAARAELILRDVRSRGHGALGCNVAELATAATMISLRRFDVADDALVAGDHRLRWTAITAYIRAIHRTRTETASTRREKRFDLTRALVTGGLKTTKTTTREVVTHSADAEAVLYVFQRGGPPWILREQGTHFTALGAQVSASTQHNFALAVERFQSRAPHAPFDDRLVARKTSAEEADLLAQLVSAWLEMGR